jgi:hypothetical protein
MTATLPDWTDGMNHAPRRQVEPGTDLCLSGAATIQRLAVLQQ